VPIAAKSGALNASGFTLSFAHFTLRGVATEPRFVRHLRDVDARVERNGEVSYHWRTDGSEAFRDRGPEIAFSDIRDSSLAAVLELACQVGQHRHPRRRRLQSARTRHRDRVRDARGQS